MTQPTEFPTRTSNQDSFWSRHWQQLIAVLLWLLLLAGYYWYTSTNNLGPFAALQQLVEIMQNSAYGPLIYIGVYALRPLIFFSALLLTVLGGFLFGPIWGIVYTVIAGNTSAMVAYMIGRFLGRDVLDEENAQGIVQRYANRMRRNSFETVLIMRFIFLPYDLVNYLAGFLQIDWKAFLLATILGSIPGTISFVLFGASIEGDLSGGLPSLDPRALAASVVIFLISLGLSRYFKRKEKQEDGAAATP